MNYPAVFLDKDGTLVENVPYNVDPQRIRLMPRALEGLTLLHGAGYLLFVVSNQPGVAKGYFREEDLIGVEDRLTELLGEAGIPLAGFCWCPHHPAGCVPAYTCACRCRKPQAGMILRAAAQRDLDLPQSWLVGDILDDVEAGRRAGCRTVLLVNGSETQWKFSPLRMPDRMTLNLEEAAMKILAAGPPEKMFYHYSQPLGVER